MLFFAHFHSQISYGIIFWGSSVSLRNVFIIKKGAIRIMLRLGPRSSCRECFKKLDILAVPCLYIYALMLFAVGGTWWCSWFRHYATTQKVTGSIPDDVIGIFH
jgi:hypothetical protein